jgi:mannose-1-phosphate guanylyltransferase
MADITTRGGENDPRGLRAHPGWAERWAIILAGGDGTRLRDLTRRIAGDDRPKQFCPLLGEETLLGETRRRVALGIPAARTVFSVTSPHERYYAPLLADVSPRQIVAQPKNRGTAPAILYALLRVAAIAPNEPVAIFPSDHYVSDDEAFMAHVGAAFDLAVARPDLVALLGVSPDRPETEYGWIERAQPVLGPQGWPLYRVRRFWEKPDPDLARTLLADGCLWNSFVMVGRVASLLGLIDRALPDLSQALLPLRQFLGTPVEAAVAETIYQRLPSADFSRGVLGPNPALLAVLPVRGVEWSDLGHPERVLARRGTMPAPWAEVTPPRELATAAAV